MKKIMLVGAVALLALASCKKDRTCECTVNGVKQTDSTPETYKKVTKTFMKNHAGCVSYEVTEGTETTKVECEIK
jgi:hypothetical protein